MKLFLDTANLDEIREAKTWGVLAGCTTNPSLLAREHADYELQMKEVCNEVPGPVSLETTETEAEAMYAQGMKLASVALALPLAVPRQETCPQVPRRQPILSQAVGRIPYASSYDKAVCM